MSPSREPSPSGDESEAIPVPRDVAPLDPVLQFLCALANESHLELSIRLTLAGGTLSGTLVGGQQYFRAIAQATRSVLSGPEEGKDGLGQYFDFMAEIYEEQRDDADDRRIVFIHLKDAWLFTPGAPPLLVGEWRGRLDAIQGWSIGTYSEQE